MKHAVWLLGLMLLTTSATARNDGRYANSPLKGWFEGLQSEFGQCCSDADGYFIADVDWESDHGHYRVHIDDEWVMVPDRAVVTQDHGVEVLYRRSSAGPLFHAGTYDVTCRSRV